MPIVDATSGNNKVKKLHDGRTLGYAEYGSSEAKPHTRSLCSYSRTWPATRLTVLTTSWRAQQQRRTRVRVLFLSMVMLVFALPVIWTVLASFDITPDDATTPPTWRVQPSLANYMEIGVAEPTFGQEVLTSTLLALLATMITSSVAFLAAYGLARSRARRRALLVQSFLVLASVPIMAYVIPLNDTMQRLHLTDTFVGVALAGSAVYILYGYLGQPTRELEEAARLDGATPIQILWWIVLPSVAPDLVARGKGSGATPRQRNRRERIPRGELEWFAH